MSDFCFLKVDKGFDDGTRPLRIRYCEGYIRYKLICNSCSDLLVWYLS